MDQETIFTYEEARVAGANSKILRLIAAVKNHLEKLNKNIDPFSLNVEFFHEVMQLQEEMTKQDWEELNNYSLAFLEELPEERKQSTKEILRKFEVFNQALKNLRES